MALPTFVATGASTVGLNAISVPWPTAGSYAVGDLGILLIQTCNEAVPSTPAGWTACPSSPQGTGTAATAGSTRLTAFYRYATSTSEANASVGDSGNHQIAFIVVFSGVDGTTPFNTSAGAVLTPASASVSIPGVTTTVNDCLIFAIVANGTDTATNQTTAGGFSNASLANVTRVVNGNTATGLGGGLSGATGEMATAGAVSATTTTLTTSSLQGLLTLAIQPPASGTPVSGSGSPSTSLSASASGTGVESFIGSGSPSKSLSASAAGTGVESFIGSGAPATSLSAGASGTGVETFTGSGSPATTLGASASGTGQVDNPPTPVSGSGSPATTLSASAAGTGVESFIGSGSPSKSLSASAAGTGVETFIGSGSPSKTLSASASGTGSHTQGITGSGSPSKTLSASASGTAEITGEGVVTRRPASGWRRILYDPEGAEEAADQGTPRERPAIEPDPLPELPALPAPVERTPAAKLPKVAGKGAIVSAIADDEEEIEFIINVVLDMD